MNENKTPKYLPDYAVPPGDLLREWLEILKVSSKEFAKMANLSHTLVKLLLIGAYPINDIIAERLSHMTGRSKDFWLRAEKNYTDDLERLKLERPKPTHET